MRPVNLEGHGSDLSATTTSDSDLAFEGAGESEWWEQDAGGGSGLCKVFQRSRSPGQQQRGPLVLQGLDVHLEDDPLFVRGLFFAGVADEL